MLYIPSIFKYFSCPLWPLIIFLIFKNSLLFSHDFDSTFFAGETVDKLYTPSKASDTRDAMAKELYYRLFSWLLARINIYLNSQDSAGASSIGKLEEGWEGNFSNFNSQANASVFD